jgi:hypothetical protein
MASLVIEILVKLEPGQTGIREPVPQDSLILTIYCCVRWKVVEEMAGLVVEILVKLEPGHVDTVRPAGGQPETAQVRLHTPELFMFLISGPEPSNFLAGAVSRSINDQVLHYRYVGHRKMSDPQHFFFSGAGAAPK